MQKIYFVVLAVLLASTSCKKSSTTDTPADADKYMSITAGSSWQYRTVNNTTSATTNYSLTSTNRDSSINGKNYHVFTNSNGGNSEYYLVSGNDYYTFRSLGVAVGNTSFENLYLKDNSAAGASWSQSISLTVPGVPIPVPITLTYTIVDKGSSRTVNGISYSDVIHVKTSITSSLIPAANLTTDIHNYYARKVGMIENTNILNLNFSGIVQNTDTKTILLSSDIK